MGLKSLDVTGFKKPGRSNKVKALLKIVERVNYQPFLDKIQCIDEKTSKLINHVTETKANKNYSKFKYKWAEIETFFENEGRKKLISVFNDFEKYANKKTREFTEFGQRNYIPDQRNGYAYEECFSQCWIVASDKVKKDDEVVENYNSCTNKIERLKAALVFLLDAFMSEIEARLDQSSIDSEELSHYENIISLLAGMNQNLFHSKSKLYRMKYSDMKFDEKKVRVLDKIDKIKAIIKEEKTFSPPPLSPKL